MANFNAYIPLLLQVEGGYQANPNDPGNFNSLGQNVGTNKGISAKFYESIIKRPPTVADMMAITTELAKNLYKKYFWDKCQADNIINQQVANTIVDHHVNSGQGIRLAQKVLNEDFNKNLTLDNSMGPLTLAAINSTPPATFVDKYNKARAAFYKSIGNETFYQGWLNRLKKFAWAGAEFAEKNKYAMGLIILGVATLGIFFLTNKK